MNLNDIIVFIAILLFMGYSLIQRLWLAYLKRSQPERYAALKKKEEEKLKAIFSEMDLDYKEEEKEERQLDSSSQKKMPQKKTVRAQHESPRRVLSDDFRFKSTLDQYKQKTNIEERALKPKTAGTKFDTGYGQDLVSDDLQRTIPLDSKRPIEKSRLNLLVSRLDSRRLLIIANEVIGPPVSLKKDIFEF